VTNTAAQSTATAATSIGVRSRLLVLPLSIIESSEDPRGGAYCEEIQPRAPGPVHFARSTPAGPSSREAPAPARARPVPRIADAPAPGAPGFGLWDRATSVPQLGPLVDVGLVSPPPPPPLPPPLPRCACSAGAGRLGFAPRARRLVTPRTWREALICATLQAQLHVEVHVAMGGAALPGGPAVAACKQPRLPPTAAY
jgi:hypothetical protein